MSDNVIKAAVLVSSKTNVCDKVYTSDQIAEIFKVSVKQFSGRGCWDSFIGIALLSF